MKIFISQPMDGKSSEEVQAEFEIALGKIKAFMTPDEVKKMEIIDSYITESPPAHLKGGAIGIWYLGRSIEKLANAELAIFLSGWHLARGCRIEEYVANQYGITCRYL